MSTANLVPKLYVERENDWATRAAWAWWHWLDETWCGWWRFGYSSTGARYAEATP